MLRYSYRYYFRFSEAEFQAFASIMKLERGFRAIISACKDDTTLFLAIISKVRAHICILLSFSELVKISEAAAASRSDDTTKLKSAILTYLHEDPKQGSRFSADFEFGLLVPSDPKEARGFRHFDTAVHLCPLRLRAEFERDPL
jgi:hypothetical protein